MSDGLVSIDLSTSGTPDAAKQIVAAMHGDGCVALRGLLDPQTVADMNASYAAAYPEAFAPENPDDQLVVGDRRRKVSVRFDPPFNSPSLSAHPAVTTALSIVLGEQFVVASLAAVTSLPGAADQDLHRDHPWLFGTPLDRMLPAYAVKLVVPLVAMTAESGPTRIWPGSHRRHDDEVAGMPPADPDLSPGDAMLVDYRIYHQGVANRSDDPRTVLFLSYSRPWFIDHVNFPNQPRLTLSEARYRKLPEAQRKLFRLALRSF